MKRSEFADIVNEVAKEERKLLSEVLSDAVKNGENSQEKIAKMFADGLMQATNASARSAAKLIERLGLVSLTDD